MKKYIVGVVLSLGIFVSPALTQAAGLSDSQIQAILGLLSSFGADSATIANVQLSLNGGTPTVEKKKFCHTFDRDLTVGSRGDEVVALNQALSSSGVDTTGNSSDFSENNAGDVVAFQAKYGIRQTGYVGPLTRAKLNALYRCGNGEHPTPPPTRPTTFSATPTSGATPLAVKFHVVTESGTSDTLSIDFGDGTTGTTYPTGVGCSMTYCPYYGGADHTYASAGIYTATLFFRESVNCPAGAMCNIAPQQRIGTAIITVGGQSLSVSEQVKCVFNGATTEQKCWGDVPASTVNTPVERYSCAGVGTCVVTVSGEKGRPITWGSSCGGGVYTTIDGNSEYANFICEASNSTPVIAIISPNGGGYWDQGSSALVEWKTANIPQNNQMLIRLRSVDTNREYNLVTTSNDGNEKIIVSNDIPPGAYTLEIKTSLNNQSYSDASDSYFKVVGQAPPPLQVISPAAPIGERDWSAIGVTATKVSVPYIYVNYANMPPAGVEVVSQSTGNVIWRQELTSTDGFSGLSVISLPGYYVDNANYYGYYILRAFGSEDRTYAKSLPFYLGGRGY